MRREVAPCGSNEVVDITIVVPVIYFRKYVLVERAGLSLTTI